MEDLFSGWENVEWMVKRIILVIFGPFSVKILMMKMRILLLWKRGKIFKWFLWKFQEILKEFYIVNVLMVYFRALNIKKVRLYGFQLI